MSVPNPKSKPSSTFWFQPQTPNATHPPDMEQQYQPLPIDDQGNESSIPLIVSIPPTKPRHSRRMHVVGPVSSTKRVTGQIIAIAVGVIFFAYLTTWMSGLRGARLTVGEVFGEWKDAMPWKCGNYTGDNSTFTRAMYGTSVPSEDAIGPDAHVHLRESANATFALDLLRGLAVQVPEGLDGEIVISRSADLESKGLIVLETFRYADDKRVLASTGIWSGTGAGKSDQLCIEASGTPDIYHRLHVILPLDSTFVPPLYTNLPLRLSPASLFDISFTALGLSTRTGDDRDIVGRYNVSKEIMFSTTHGKVDVDIWVISAPNFDKSDTLTDAEANSLPNIHANTESGPITLRVHPSDSKHPYIHPVNIGANTNTGNVIVRDSTFLGTVEVAAHRGVAVIEIGDGEEKELKISDKWRGFVKGTIEKVGGEEKGLSVVQAVTFRGDLELVL